MRSSVGIRTVTSRLLLSNYGSFLQHLALRSIIESFGFNVVRCVSADDEDSIAVMLRKIILSIARVPYYAIFKKEQIQTAIELYRSTPSIATRVKFIIDYHRLIGGIREEIPRAGLKAIVLGGDQCFRIDVIESLVKNIESGTKLVSFAASADWVDLQARRNWMDRTTLGCSNFSAIGLRERYGVALLNNMCKISPRAEVVADPVLCVTQDWLAKLAPQKKSFNKPTLLCYILNISDKDSFRIEVFNNLARMVGCDLKIVAIQGAEHFVPKKLLIHVGPCDFIGLIRDAEYVITNSFHGSILALQFHKNFITLRQKQSSQSGQNIRLDELFDNINLRGRLMPENAGEDELFKAINTGIDWVELDCHGEAIRDKSVSWLRKCLSK